MSRVPLGAARATGEPFGPRVRERYQRDSFSQGLGAEDIARRWGLSRDQLDEFALESHRKAAAATDARRLRRPARPGHRPGRRAQGRRGDPAGHLAGEARGAQARLPRRRRHPRGQQLADLRRLRGAADHHQRAGGRARPAAAGAVPLRRGDRRRPGDDADRADPGHREGAQAGGADDRRHRRVRGQRGVRERAPGLGGGNRGRPSGSTRSAARSPSGTRSARPGAS